MRYLFFSFYVINFFLLQHVNHVWAFPETFQIEELDEKDDESCKIPCGGTVDNPHIHCCPDENCSAGEIESKCCAKDLNPCKGDCCPKGKVCDDSKGGCVNCPADTPKSCSNGDCCPENKNCTGNEETPCCSEGFTRLCGGFCCYDFTSCVSWTDEKEERKTGCRIECLEDETFCGRHDEDGNNICCPKGSRCGDCKGKKDCPNCLPLECEKFCGFADDGVSVICCKANQECDYDEEPIGCKGTSCAENQLHCEHDNAPSVCCDRATQICTGEPDLPCCPIEKPNKCGNKCCYGPCCEGECLPHGSTRCLDEEGICVNSCLPGQHCPNCCLYGEDQCDDGSCCESGTKCAKNGGCEPISNTDASPEPTSSSF